MTGYHIILGGFYLLLEQGKNRLEPVFILVIRTKGENIGKNISITVKTFTPHSTGYLEHLLKTVTMEEYK